MTDFNPDQSIHPTEAHMELRRDPITQSWVIQQMTESTWAKEGVCPLCPGNESLCPPNIYVHPPGGPFWQVRVIPHRYPVYQVEGDAQRRGEGIYDRMRNLGAHEIVIESPDHVRPFSGLTDVEAAQALRAYVARIVDLKRDLRFLYVTLFRNVGQPAGQELEHPHSEITATPFIPRRVAYELRSAQRHFEAKERCLFCDMVKQELEQQVRTVESNDLFVAFCPYASRVPYETWVLPIYHHSSFEEDVTGWDKQIRLGHLLKSTLRRLTSRAPAYHLVLHTSPNVQAKHQPEGHWQTLAGDYHWHIEIMPIVPGKAKSYSFKEVYYNALPPPEVAAKELRAVDIEAKP
jgi:UDPglucose--hexose-1-phosphate uridylyltransferase